MTLNMKWRFLILIGFCDNIYFITFVKITNFYILIYYFLNQLRFYIYFTNIFLNQLKFFFTIVIYFLTSITFIDIRSVLL